MSVLNDPSGKAILDYDQTKQDAKIIVKSEICDDDVIDVGYLFRTFDQMPLCETLALARCKGKILDVGAGAGAHSLYLSQTGADVSCIDTSALSVEYLQSKGLDARNLEFQELKNERYDTILMMMNGIGIAGDLSKLPSFLEHAKSLLQANGKILCDSTDIKYLYQEDDGGYWVELSTEYYGNFRFQMTYKDHTSDWFDWLYVDFDSLSEMAEGVGFEVSKVHEDDHHYLAELTLK
jgi:cyclopropane fatty-acyl-phospholipid synthase-like methyltransferase